MRKLFWWLLPSICVLCFSCSGNYTIQVLADNKANVSFNTTVDSATLNSVIDKVKQISSSDIANAQITFFDQKQFTKGLNSLPGVQVISIKQDSPDNISGNFIIDDLTKLEPVKSSPKLFTITHSQNKNTLSFNLTKENAKTAFQLFPGINSSIIDALSPPALYEDDLSQDEYRQNLLLFFGKNHISAIDTSKCTFVVSVPGTIISSSGLSVSGNRATYSFSLLDLLVLNKPLQFQIFWK